MELAKITAKGQITIPIAIRKLLGVKGGDKVMFVGDGNRVVMMNASVEALIELQDAFKGAVAKAGITNEQDIVDMVKEIRTERSGKYICE